MAMKFQGGFRGEVQMNFLAPFAFDDRQITHLICVRLKHLLYDLSSGCFRAFYIRKTTGSGPRTPQKVI